MLHPPGILAMSSDAPDLPFDSPLVPAKLGKRDELRFNCHQGISCFNACCRQADITLTPYDVVRLKKGLGITSTEFLQQHTVPFEMDQHGMPGIKLRTEDEAPVCLLVSDQGCSVYEDRPTACRYYPAGLMAMKESEATSDEAHYFLVREDHCHGHNESRSISLEGYRKEQGVVEYDELNREWYQIILKKRSAGPAVGKPPEISFQLFFMASYDIDRFRRFVLSEAFTKTYVLEEKALSLLKSSDADLMQFGFKLMKQVFFDEQTIAMVDQAIEKRWDERKEIIEARHKAEVDRHLAKQEQAKRDAVDEE